jgi:hypothetical protein
VVSESSEQAAGAGRAGIAVADRLVSAIEQVRPAWAGAWALDWARGELERGRVAWAGVSPADEAEALRRAAGEAMGAGARAAEAAPRPRSAWPVLWGLVLDLPLVWRRRQTLADLEAWWTRAGVERAGVRQGRAWAKIHAERAARASAADWETWAEALAASAATGWGAGLKASGEHPIYGLQSADLAGERARAEAAVTLLAALVREMDAAAGMVGAGAEAPAPPEDEAIAEAAERALEAAPPVAACADLGPAPTLEARLALAERLTAEGRAAEAAERPGIPLQMERWWAPLSVFGRDIHTARESPAELMPAWLAELAMELAKGLGEGAIADLCAGLAGRARAWRRLDPAAWERLEFDLLDAAVAAARESAEAASRILPSRRPEGEEMASEAAGRGVSVREAELMAWADARRAALNGEARRRPGARAHHVATAAESAAGAAGQAAWGRVMATGGVFRSARAAQAAHDAAVAATCRALMERLFAGLDAALAGRA